jgi:hypothetical protein
LKQLLAALVVISSYNGASYFPNIIFMDEQPKIVKRRRARSIESKTESDMANESSFALPNSDVEPAELAEVEQSGKFVEPPMPGESWSAIDRKPSSSYYPAISQWKEDLREIRQESDLDVWSSCPYD